LRDGGPVGRKEMVGMGTSRLATHASTNERRTAPDILNGRTRRTIAVGSMDARGSRRAKACVALVVMGITVTLLGVTAGVGGAAAGDTTRVSVDSSGNQANNGATYPAISSDGRFVAFVSGANNLVPGDTNGRQDVFVRDRQTGTTERVSLSSSGAQPNTHTGSTVSISADGRFVAFVSNATNLVPGDTNRKSDIFVHEFRVDTKAPKVVSAGPARDATGVGTGTNVKATFSERMYEVKANFKLYHKSSGTPVAAAVHPVAGSSASKWVLDPNRPLRAGTTYVAKVRTGVVDKVGHHLDQSPTLSGNQPKEWTFKTRR
jgi:hypothetical protein